MQKTTLKRQLKLSSLVIFGLAIMAPGTVFSTYGIAAQITQGTVSGAYILAAIALSFTVYSYGKMVKAFPIAGSAYTYAQQAFNSKVGFMVGWALLTDYLLLPMVNFLISSIFLSSMFPSVPSYVWILLYIIITTVINCRGIKLMDRLNSVFIGISFLVIVLFCILSIKSLTEGMGAGTLLSSLPFYSPAHSFSYLLAGASLLSFSFLGFDSVTTLAEESIAPQKNIPRALFIILLLGTLIFVTVSYLATLVHPDYHQFTNADSAAVEIAAMLGGNLFVSLFMVSMIVGTFSSGLSSQASVSRVLYAMGRDSMLPSKWFGYLHPRFKTPVLNLLLVGIISTIALAISLTTATSLINFGALIAFLFVNLSVIVHYFRTCQKHSVRSLVLNVFIPAVGATFIVWLLIGLNKYAIILGGSWTILGIIYLIYLLKFKNLNTIQLELDERKTNM